MENKINVIIIDDDDAIRESLMAFLEDEGFTTESSRSAEDAFSLLDTIIAEIAIVDLRLPGIDGAEFIRQAHKKYPSMHFIIYTGSPEYSLPPDLAKIKNISPKTYMKPLYDLSELTNAIKKIFDHQ